uniref:Phospholipase-like protein n=1 Tax=Tanacetum cinerariifolium TaxID=118510 RepID=A0A6L2K1B3_TANCI|nr:hypothetical protein [Tanacetum cinerariifolium]
MDLSDIEVLRVFVTCRYIDDWTENCILLHFILGQQLELTVSGLKFGVKNSTDYNKAKNPIPFRRRVFSSDLDGRPIRGKDVGLLIESDVFMKLDDNDVVSLCCVGILQLVLLGVEDRRILLLVLLGVEDRHHVPNWILSDPTNETDTKSYSIEGFAWAFKKWILESFRVATDDYYTRYRRHPQIVAWSSKHKFYRHMLKPMLHGQIPVERLVPDETEARSRLWVSSRAYFDGRSFEYEQIPRHLNRNNYFEGYQQMKEKNDDMYGKMTRFMEDMRRVPEANTTPIIADQHFGVSGISGFQSYQPGTSNWQNPMTSRRQDAGILDPILIRERTENANWTLAKSGTVCLHPENNHFMILTDPHNIRTLDGSVRPFSSWNDVTWVLILLIYCVKTL